MSFLRQAFDIACDGAKKPECWYVILVESYRAYGGPEEGGWWYTVANLEAYREFSTREAAEAAAEKVKELAAELEKEASRSHGEYCLRSMEWLEARGLDADYLPEPDGPNEYRVSVVDELPTFSNRRPHYC